MVKKSFILESINGCSSDFAAFANHSSFSSGAESGLLAICTAMSASDRLSNQAKNSGVTMARASASALGVMVTIFFDFSVIGFPRTDQTSNILSPCIHNHEYSVPQRCDRASRNKTGLSVGVADVSFFTASNSNTHDHQST